MITMNNEDIFLVFDTMLQSANDAVRAKLKQAQQDLQAAKRNRSDIKNIERTIKGLESRINENNRVIRKYKEVIKTYRGLNKMVNACDQFIINGLLNKMQDSREKKRVLGVFRRIREEKDAALEGFRQLLTDPHNHINIGGKLDVRMILKQEKNHSI